MENCVVHDLPPAAALTELVKINTVAATPSTVAYENILKNKGKTKARLDKLPEFKVLKGKSKIALVGGGPSLKFTLDELRTNHVIMACGSSYDYLIDQGIIPTYCTICDPDPISANYITKAHDKTCFLVASCCDEKVFETLKGKNVVIWHCHSDDIQSKENLEEILGEPYYAVGGGCTVGLRSLSVAILLGYSNIHFFGFDSCIEDNDHHAYGFSSNEEELGEIYEIKIGMHTDIKEKVFKCSGYMVAQLAHFKEYYREFNQFFQPTFHGDGLLATWFKMVQDEIEVLKNKYEQERKSIIGAGV